MKPPIVVNKNKHDYEVPITRGHKFGNPSILGEHGTREDVINKFESYTRVTFSKEEILTLENTVLGRVCKPLACHGDILVKLFKEYSQ